VSRKKIKEYINSNRRDFSNKPFNKEMAHDDPIKQYERWFEEAVESEILDPYAACLSTVDFEGKPSSRILYIRDFSNNGFIFYTNFNSKKGNDLNKNKYGSLNVFWPDLERQIRIQGEIEKVNKSISDKYFNARPRSSQIGAWASNQSENLHNRAELEAKIEFFKEKFKNIEVPRPPHWGGYCLVPFLMEFWQGRPSRLHDRIVYNKESNKWIKSRLSP
jgi:pyridoxamine 5'-phosphate oxidase